MSVIVRLSGRGEVPMIPEPIVILDSGFMTLEREREREREREGERDDHHVFEQVSLPICLNII